MKKLIALFARFIPARAGNTMRPPTERRIRSVHPRTCGEYLSLTLTAFIPGGSSPHVRGIRALSCCPGVRVRFIPARAGNTTSIERMMSHCSVHPRTCGEYGGHVLSSRHRRGSSPHVRGIRKAIEEATFSARFIPARAGNTTQMSTNCADCAVHPRTCGEYLG